MTRHSNIILLSMVVFLILFASNTAYADTFAPAGVLETVMDKFQTQSRMWVAHIKVYARNLFFALVIISMVWNFGQMVFRYANIAEFFFELIRFLVFTGLFLWFLESAPLMSEAIIDSFRQLAGEASGTKNMSPGDIISVAFDIVRKVWSVSSFMNPSSIGAVIVSLVIMALLCTIAVNMMLVIISSWILAYAGVFFLGFGGSRWTSDMAINYFKTVLATGAAMMTMLLLVSIGENILNEYYEGLKLNGDKTVDEVLVMFIVALTLFLLVEKLPPMVAGIVSGASIGMSTGVGSFGMGAATGAGMTAYGMVRGHIPTPGKAFSLIKGGLANREANAARAVDNLPSWAKAQGGNSGGENGGSKLPN